MKRFILILSMILSLVSCSEFLDEVPKDKLSDANFYSNIEEVESAVTAIYAPIRTLYSSPVYTMQIEINADYAYGRGSTFPIGGEYTGLDATNIARVGIVWDGFYRAIGFANVAIEKIPEIEAEESVKNALISEARFLRAYSYYQLVRNWGAVPLRLTTGGEDIGRTNESEVYEAIISDLKVGENDLPSTPRQNGRPTKWAAKSLLAEVYLTMEEWELARDKADEVIKSNQFSLVEVSVANDFDNIFGASADGTSEEIFYLKYSHQNGTKWPYFFLWKDVTFSNYGGYVVYSYPDNPFIKNWDSNDLRKQWDIFTEYVNKDGDTVQLPSTYPVCFSKYKDTGAPSKNQHANDYHAIRYADVLLIYAEAASQAANGPTTEAIEFLNKIKRRAYGYPSSSPSPVDYPDGGWTVESFQDTVLQERAYEFICEGKRWLDLKRTGTVEEVILAHKGKVVNKKMLWWPIPQSEIDTNTLINQENQNPGY